MIKVAVTGACGKMGSSIIKSVNAQEDLELVCAVEAPGCESRGEDIGNVIGIGRTGVELTTSDVLDNALKKAKPDCLIDFTTPKAAVKTVEIAADNGVNVVVGTTGFSSGETDRICNAIKKSGISAVISPNMAIATNVFFKVVQEVARYLGEDYDVEIIETHHRHKKDSPSGTAIKVGELIAEALDRDVNKAGVFGRGRGVIGERSREEIGFHAVRAGDIVGDHTVLFAGNEERIEVTHRAQSRQAFVNGALRAVRFLCEKGEKGRIYSTWDVLGIK